MSVTRRNLSHLMRTVVQCQFWLKSLQQPCNDVCPKSQQSLLMGFEPGTFNSELKFYLTVPFSLFLCYSPTLPAHVVWVFVWEIVIVFIWIFCHYFKGHDWRILCFFFIHPTLKLVENKPAFSGQKSGFITIWYHGLPCVNATLNFIKDTQIKTFKKISKKIFSDLYFPINICMICMIFPMKKIKIVFFLLTLIWYIVSLFDEVSYKNRKKESSLCICSPKKLIWKFIKKNYQRSWQSLWTQ